MKLNPSGPQREAGFQREKFNQDDEIPNSFCTFNQIKANTGSFDSLLSVFLVVKACN